MLRGRAAACALVVLALAVGCTSDPPSAGTIPSDLPTASFQGTVHPATDTAAPSPSTGPSSPGSGSSGSRSSAEVSVVSSSVTTRPTATDQTGKSDPPGTSGSGSPTGGQEGSTKRSTPTQPSTKPGNGGTTTTPSGTSRPTDASDPTTTDRTISAAEAADRQAIEDVWMRYWDVIYRMQEIPTEKRRAVYGDVMVNPELQNTLDSAALNDNKHWTGYGKVTHEIHWGPPVAGKDVAVMKDCQDQSNFGVFDKSIKAAVTRGPQRANINVTFKRTAEGWKVGGLFIPPGTTC